MLGTALTTRPAMITHLEHTEPEQNCFRFYRMDVGRDLFGAWILLRSWGRIGTRGRDRIDSFASRAEAVKAQGALIAAKHRRGYRLLCEKTDR